MRTLALDLGLFTLAAAAAACGPSRLAGEPPQAPTSDEPWVKEHAALVEQGCACETSMCLEQAKAEIDGLVAEHGGLDEVPADVHRSHGKFDECFRGGTLDPMRDGKAVVDAFCACADEPCVDKAQIARLRFEEKYGAQMSSNAEVAALVVKMDECEAAKIISAKVIAAHVEKVTLAVCACASGSGCGLELNSLEDYPLAPKVLGLDEEKDRIKAAMERLCNCATNGGVVGTYGGISTRARCPKKEE